MLMKAARIGATQEHGGLARFWLRLPEDARSNFEKIKSKISRNHSSPVPVTKEGGGKQVEGAAEQKRGR
jgi:hypothetical protein